MTDGRPRGPARSSGWMWVSLTLTLLVGVSLGMVLSQMVRGDRGRAEGPRHEERRGREGRLFEKLDRELDLTEAQRAELRARLDANRDKARAFWDGTRREHAELRRQFRQEIRALLTPEQQKRYDRLISKENHRHERHQETETK